MRWPGWLRKQTTENNRSDVEDELPEPKLDWELSWLESQADQQHPKLTAPGLSGLPATTETGLTGLPAKLLGWQADDSARELQAGRQQSLSASGLREGSSTSSSGSTSSAGSNTGFSRTQHINPEKGTGVSAGYQWLLFSSKVMKGNAAQDQPYHSALHPCAGKCLAPGKLGAPK